MGRRWWGGPLFFHVVGRGPARPIKFSEARPARPVNFFRGWAAARPGPSNSKLYRPGPARPINYSNLSAPPGPAHDSRSEAHETRASYGPARGFKEAGNGPAHGQAHVLPRTKKCTLSFFFIFS